MMQALRTASESIVRCFRIDTVGPPFALYLSRGLAGGTFLDRNKVTERVLHVVRHFEKIDQSKVTPEASFSKDLGLDSLDTVEVVMAMEEEFGVEIPDEEADKISTTKEAIDYISSHPQAQ